MDLSNNQPQIKPLPTWAKVFCCIVLFICSAAIPLLTYYIGTEGVDPMIPTALAFATFALCAAFILVLCKKPLFLGCTIAVALILALLSPFFSVMFLALLCATVAGAILFTGAVRAQYFSIAAIAAIAYGTAFGLTSDPLLAAETLLPVLTALALGICYRKHDSVIISVGVATGALLAGYLALTICQALLAGMQPNMQGVTEYIKAYHAAISAALAESVQLMAETPEIATQLAPMLGGEVNAENIAEFSDSVASAVLGMLPGVTIMMTWIFAFIANRGFTALLVRGMDKKDYPVQLTAYTPSVPTAVFMILCYVALFIFSLLPQGETPVFIALNLLLALMPLMSVCGIISIIANIKHAKVKWPLLLTYALSIIFLGIAVIPMVAFFGSFAVITNAIASTLEKKFTDFKGE